MMIIKGISRTEVSKGMRASASAQAGQEEER